MQRFVLELTADGWMFSLIDMDYGPCSEPMTAVAPELNDAVHAEALALARAHGVLPPARCDWKRVGPGEYYMA